MTDDPLSARSAEVLRSRKLGEPAALAEALESLASAAMGLAAVDQAADALEEASGLWWQLGRMERAGSSLLLATSSRRLLGEHAAAERLLERAQNGVFPENIADAFETEACEQALARGDAKKALECFDRLITRLSGNIEPEAEVKLYERRATAAIACELPRRAAADMLHVATIYSAKEALTESENAALAAAALLADIDPERATRIVSEIDAVKPIDGGAAARRGMVAAKVAIGSGDPARALCCLDGARQGALDCGDPITYLAAAVQASEVAETLGKWDIAYGRLATAWGTLTDLVGRDQAANVVRPTLLALRDRMGSEAFARAKADYEAQRR